MIAPATLGEAWRACIALPPAEAMRLQAELGFITCSVGGVPTARYRALRANPNAPFLHAGDVR